MLKQVQHDKVCAFTLAEVLITLGIIGIVAAMTIPTLMQKTNEKETVSKLKKINYVMSNAYKNYIAINGKPEFMSRDENGGAASEYVYQIFAPYLKIVSDCGLVDSNANCVPNVVYKYKKGTDYSNLTTKDIYYKVLLADGSSLMFVASNNAEYTSQKRLAAFNVDTNGKKGPNKLGADLFQFYIMNDGTIKAQGFGVNSQCVSSSSDGWGCAAWVLTYENLDYLHCSGLSWNGKTKCK